MVIETLTALRNLDYPTYEVIMVDDHPPTTNSATVVDFCYRNGIKFHLQDYPDLNLAL